MISTNKINAEKRFLIDSPILEKLRPKIEEAAELIRAFVNEGRPIIIKHHSDCDGYMGAIPLEIAISNLLDKKSRNSSWRTLRRLPSRTPFYDYGDALKDLTNYYREIISGKPPLLIIVDSGSSEQDALALRKLRQYGAKTIIVDHHVPILDNNKPLAEALADVFINPYCAGGDGNLTAGMLGTELAGFVSEDIKDVEMAHLAAISGISDKSGGSEFDQYVECARKKGYETGDLTSLALSIDYEAFFIGYSESRLIEDLVFSSKDVQRARIDLILPEIKKNEKRVVELFSRFSNIERVKGISLVSVNALALLDPGTFPPLGKAVGLFFDSLKEEPVMVLGIGKGSLTVRTNIPSFNLTELIREMKEKMNFAQIEGGGHKNAGTIHFAGPAQEEVVSFIRVYLGR